MATASGVQFFIGSQLLTRLALGFFTVVAFTYSQPCPGVDGFKSAGS
jgi:hypothetical protein